MKEIILILIIFSFFIGLALLLNFLRSRTRPGGWSGDSSDDGGSSHHSGYGGGYEGGGGGESGGGGASGDGH